MVQLETATASAAPIERGERALERGDLAAPARPSRSGWPPAAASTSSSPSHGRMIGMVVVESLTRGHRARLRADGLLAPATSRRGGAGPPRGRSAPRSRGPSAAAAMSARRRRTALTVALGPVLRLEVAAHDPQQRRRRARRRLVSVAAGDVEDAVGDVGGRGEDVGPGDVVDVDEVHRLRPVAEDQRRLPGGDALHPAHEHLGVDAVDVHPRAVDVEVAQRHVVEAVHLVEAAEHPLVEDLGRAVDRAGCRTGGGVSAVGNVSASP